jgi:hypothetical protein
MAFPALTIEASSPDSSTKTRTFSVHLLGYLAADSLWEPGGNASTERPVWVAYFGTERESHPFTANFRVGRKARTQNDYVFDLPRRAPHRWSAQKVPGGVVTVAYIPALFHLEPSGPLGDDVRFVFAPPRWWVDEQAGELAELGEDARDTARAALFCAYLDRRTPLPLVHDLRFHLQVYRAALASGWVHRLAGGRREGVVLAGRGAEAAGLDAPLACRVGQTTLAEFLVEQTSLYHQEEIRRGTTRFATGGRLLPYPPEAPAQLCLDFAVA